MLLAPRIAAILAFGIALFATPRASADVPSYDPCGGGSSGRSCAAHVDDFDYVGLCNAGRCDPNVPIATIAAARDGERRSESLATALLLGVPPVLVGILALAWIRIAAAARRRRTERLAAIDSAFAPAPPSRARRALFLAAAIVAAITASAITARGRRLLSLSARHPGDRPDGAARLSIATRYEPPILIRRAGEDELVALLRVEGAGHHGDFLAGYDVASRAPRWFLGLEGDDLRDPLRYAATREHLVVIDGLGDVRIESLATGEITARAKIEYRIRDLSAHPDGSERVWFHDVRFHPDFVLDARTGAISREWTRPAWAKTGSSRFEEACYPARSDAVAGAIHDGAEWITGCEAGGLAAGAGRKDGRWELAVVDRATKAARWTAGADLLASEGKYPTVEYLELVAGVLLSTERCDGQSCLSARDVETGNVLWRSPARRRLIRAQPLSTDHHLLLEVDGGDGRSAIEIRSRDTGQVEGYIPG